MKTKISTAILGVLIASILLTTFPLSTFQARGLGEGWLDGWEYRVPITIGSAAGAGTNYQLNFTVTNDDGVSSGNTIYLNGSARSDFGDVRFTASDGETELDYWIAQTTSTYAGQDWVKDGIVLTPSGWEGIDLVEPCALEMENGTIQLWYRGGGRSPYPMGIGYAWSNDGGLTFTKYSGNPQVGGTTGDQPQGTWVVNNGSNYLLYVAEGYGWWGAKRYINVFTSTDYGVTWTKIKEDGLPVQAWHTSTSLANPRVWKEGDYQWYMIYTAWETARGTWAAGLATSTDGLNWTPYASNPIIHNSGTGVPHNVSGVYGLWHHYCNLPSDILFSKSSDLMAWVESGNSPVLERTETWEGYGSAEGQIADPTFLTVAGESTVFYDALQNQTTALSYIARAHSAQTFDEMVLEAGEAESATFWVEVSEDLTDGGTIYVYFGNNTATYPFGADQAEMDATFPFADQFYGSAINTTKWAWNTTKAAVSGGVMTFTADAGDWVLLQNAANYPHIGFNYSVVANVTFTDNEYNGLGLMQGGVALWEQKRIWYCVQGDGYLDYTINRDTADSLKKSNFTTGSFRTFEMKRFSTATKWYDNGVEVENGTQTTQIPTVDLGVFFFAGTAADHLHADYVFIRKCVITEPAITAYGEFETYENAVPAINQFYLDLTGAEYKGAKTLLSTKQDYKFVLKVSDTNGVTDINYAQIRLDPSSRNVILRATRSSGDVWTFSEQSDPNNYVTLNVEGSSHSTDGNQKTFNFQVMFNWAWGNSFENIAVQSYVIDSYGENAQQSHANTFGVESTLTANTLQVNDYRVNPSQSLTFSGSLFYTGTTIYPPNGDYQVKVLLNDVQKGATDTTLFNGAFSIAANAESIIAAYNYKVSASYIVSQGSFPSVIVDRVNVNISVNSTSPEAGDTIQSTITSTYAYSGTSAPATVNILRNGTHYSTGNFADSLPGAGRYVYTTENVFESTYGLTTFSSNTLTVIWADFQIEITQASIPYSRVNVNSFHTSYWHSRFSNNQSSVPAGTLYVNGTGFAINSTGWAEATFNSSSAQIASLTVTGVDINGVTDFNQIAPNPTVYWDTLQIQTSFADLDTDTVYVRTVFESDQSPVSNGNVSYFNSYSQTDSNGWATFVLLTQSQVSHGLTAYPVSWQTVNISSQNQTVNFTKITHAQFVLRSTDAITGQSWNGNTGWLTFNASGTVTIYTGTYGIPSKVTVDEADYYDWSYDTLTFKVTIYNLDSAVGVNWAQPSPTQPPSGGGPPISTTTYVVTIQVVEGNYAVIGASVSIGSQTRTTDGAGYATFSLEAGTHNVRVTIGGALVYSQQIYVNKDSVFLVDIQHPEAPPEDITPEATSPPPPIPTSTLQIGLVIVAAVIAVGFVLYESDRAKKKKPLSPPTNPKGSSAWKKK